MLKPSGRITSPGCRFILLTHLLASLVPYLQDSLFKLDLKSLEDGKGKSPYDPRHTAASVFAGEGPDGWLLRMLQKGLAQKYFASWGKGHGDPQCLT